MYIEGVPQGLLHIVCLQMRRCCQATKPGMGWVEVKEGTENCGSLRREQERRQVRGVWGGLKDNNRNAGLEEENEEKKQPEDLWRHEMPAADSAVMVEVLSLVKTLKVSLVNYCVNIQDNSVSII